MKNAEPLLKAEFVIHGHNLDLVRISERAGLRPTRVWQHQRPIKNEPPGLHNTEWCFGEKTRGGDLDTVVSCVVDELWDHREDLQQAAREQGALLDISCSATFRGHRPECALKRTTVERLAEFHAPIHLDVYDYSSKSHGLRP